MANRKHELIENEYYHIYNRGNGKSRIFLDESDYQHFIKLLYICNSENRCNFREYVVNKNIDAFDFERGKPLISILTWVLMPNHFHILIVSQRSDLWEKGYNPITEFMRKVSTAYAMYFNNKYSRTGSLFEGKFKSSHIGVDNYFKYLFAYIHLNPIKLIQKDWKDNGIKDKARAKNFLEKYKYSSFIDYFSGSNRNYGKIIDHNEIQKEFKKAHIKELFDWIKLDK